ncbi:hypothetical protein PoB_006006100 [Plakobranchus ocellatus]|uniref:Uncharacterized protein n=1 Tax=Plakobranchus ocellatus TaxID=259542 RepID=A0AAV4CNW3_9GAST|nr:hypothetical protein PoB_006006100 [Plakobranchus ocellatus]
MFVKNVVLCDNCWPGRSGRQGISGYPLYSRSTSCSDKFPVIGMRQRKEKKKKNSLRNSLSMQREGKGEGFCSKVISGFWALCQARAPVAGLEFATEGPLTDLRKDSLASVPPTPPGKKERRSLYDVVIVVKLWRPITTWAGYITCKLVRVLVRILVLVLGNLQPTETLKVLRLVPHSVSAWPTGTALVAQK